MEIEYELTGSDILALAKHRLQHTPTLRRRLRMRRFGYAIGFILVALGTWLLRADIILPIIFLALAIISFLLFPTYYGWRLRRSVSQAYQDEKKRATLGIRTLRATSDGLEEESPYGEIRLKWDVVDEIAVTPAHTFISIGQVPSLIIPKDQVSPEAYEEFIRACHSCKENAAAKHIG